STYQRPLQRGVMPSIQHAARKSDALICYPLPVLPRMLGAISDPMAMSAQANIAAKMEVTMPEARASPTRRNVPLHAYSGFVILVMVAEALRRSCVAAPSCLFGAFTYYTSITSIPFLRRPFVNSEVACLSVISRRMRLKGPILETLLRPNLLKSATTLTSLAE